MINQMAMMLLFLLLFSCETNNNTTSSVDKEMSPTISVKHERESFQGDPMATKRVKLQLSGRIDTSNTAIKEVIQLYENYLNSQPDSLYDNPYWNKKEKAEYRDFDFSRTSLFNGLSSAQLFRSYSPFVMSVEPQNGKYQIRVLYSNTASEPPYIGSKVWCIHKLNAVKENGAWKLENLIVEETRDWNHQQVGFIEYVFSDAHPFDEKQAQTAIKYCNSIKRRFNPDFNSKFQFYLANDVDEMGLLENFDFYFTGITTGKAREGMILSSTNNEFYPHEFIHKLLPENPDRGHVIEEGVATFLGTKEDAEAYAKTMKKLADDFNKVETFTLENILNNQTKWNGYPVAYPGGALICEVIHGKKGDEGINQLIRGKTNNYDEIMALTMEILQLDEQTLIQAIEVKIEAFK